jgi:hypothetical protein
MATMMISEAPRAPQTATANLGLDSDQAMGTLVTWLRYGHASSGFTLSGMFRGNTAPIPRGEALLRDHFARGERIVDLGRL